MWVTGCQLLWLMDSSLQCDCYVSTVQLLWPFLYSKKQSAYNKLFLSVLTHWNCYQIHCMKKRVFCLTMNLENIIMNLTTHVLHLIFKALWPDLWSTATVWNHVWWSFLVCVWCYLFLVAVLCTFKSSFQIRCTTQILTLTSQCYNNVLQHSSGCDDCFHWYTLTHKYILSHITTSLMSTLLPL